MRLWPRTREIVLPSLVALVTLLTPAALAEEQTSSSSASDVQALYGWTFEEPGVPGHVPKSVFTFENAASWGWGSSYLFVDVLHSWSDADENAQEVYGEWYPSVSLLRRSGRKAPEGILRDLSVTLGINGGTRSTGAAPFVVLPGVTLDFKVPGFNLLSIGAYAYLDRGRLDGQSTNCRAVTYQLTPSWSLPFTLGSADFSFDGFVDFIGSHTDCASMIVAQPQLKVDLSGLWHKPGRLYLGVEWDYWRNKYGISGLNETVLQPMLMWTF